MKCTAFWSGVGVGMVAGAAVSMAVMPKQKSMKTCVGRSVQHMGNVMDCALADLFRAMR